MSGEGVTKRVRMSGDRRPAVEDTPNIAWSQASTATIQEKGSGICRV